MTTHSLSPCPKGPHRALTEKRGASVPTVSQPSGAPPTLQQVGSFALKALKNVKCPDGLVRS